MSRCVFRDGTMVGDYERPYIVAEVNSSHNGNVDTAKAMIDAAAQCGCDCVKFQSWSAASLYSTAYYKENPIAKRFVERFSLSPESLKKLSQYCREKGLAFSSTPYCEEEVDFLLEECQAPFVKIASMELDHPAFLRYIGRKHVPVILSTGMGEMEEIREAVSLLEEAGVSDMVLLHCISLYPTETKNLNIHNILGLRKAFPKYPVGFSDHTQGDAAAIAATALGAAVLEKHLTLDRTKVGMDNGMATEPEELRQLVDKCREIQMGMGREERVVLPEEYEQRKKMRRSLVSRRDLAEGDILKEEDLCAKRPGTGIPPNRMQEVVGRKLRRPVAADMLLRMEDME